MGAKPKCAMKVNLTHDLVTNAASAVWCRRDSLLYGEHGAEVGS